MPYTPDDSVPVAAPATATPSAAPFLIKTFDTRDANGNIVSIQGVVLVNEYGRIITPMREQTGQELIDVMQQILGFLTTGDNPSTAQ